MDIKKVLLFLKRDYLDFISYPLSMIMSLMSMFLTLFIFYFLSDVITVKGPITQYTQDYFSFVIIGIVFSTAISTGLNSIVSSIRNEQMKGTLEYLITGNMKTSELIFGLLSFDMLFEMVRLIFTLAFAVIFFGLRLNLTNSYISVIFLILSFFTFLAFGITSAGIILLTKKGNPISFLLNQANILFSGVYFPFEILPRWLRVFSYLFPTTYTLKGVRLNLLQGYGIEKLYTELIMMFILTAVLLPLSIKFFKYSVKTAKKWGTLSTY